MLERVKPFNVGSESLEQLLTKSQLNTQLPGIQLYYLGFMQSWPLAPVGGLVFMDPGA